MTEEEWDTVGRLEAWVRNYGHLKEESFINDLNILLSVARKYNNLKSVENILLSDKFLEKFTTRVTNKQRTFTDTSYGDMGLGGFCN